MNIKSTLMLSLLVLLSTLLSAMSHQVGDIEISAAWARASAPGAPSAGFMTLTNHGEQDDTLLSVSGDFAKKLELHRSFAVDGVMKMQHQKDGVRIPAGETVVFKPGGFHLMFMGLQKNFALGEEYQVLLQFEHAGEIRLTLPVQEAAMPMAH